MYWSGCWANRNAEKEASCYRAASALLPPVSCASPPLLTWSCYSVQDKKKVCLVTASPDSGTALYEWSYKLENGTRLAEICSCSLSRHTLRVSFSLLLLEVLYNPQVEGISLSKTNWIRTALHWKLPQTRISQVALNDLVQLFAKHLFVPEYCPDVSWRAGR